MRVASSAALSVQPTVYFLTPDPQEPAGGVRVIYRHVDILNAAGIHAAVLHQSRGFRCSWFDNKTRITNVGQARIMHGDLLVIPEIYVGIIDRLAPDTSYVIFNQGVHLTWRDFPEGVARYYDPENGLRGVVTVSAHSREMLGYAFEGLDIRRVHLSIDPTRFRPASGPRANRIAYMPRKMGADANQVFEILRGRGLLEGWEIVPLVNMRESAIADNLRQSKIFLSLSYQEGFGLPPLEAMACGSYVIGYHGYGGRELFRPEFNAAVETGDIVGFARAVEKVLAREKAEPGWCQAQGEKAANYVRLEYSPERERHEVARVYGDVLATR